MKYLCLSWDKLHDDIYDLAQKIKKGPNKFNLIVTIARSGLSISHILSDFLKLPITSFTISSYKDLKQAKIPKITLKLGNKLHNKKILLVDDVSDTGKTFIRGIKYLKDLGAEEIVTASLYIKPWTKFLPDYHGKSTDRWIIWPFDMQETIEILKKKYLDQGLSKEKIKKELAKIGLPQRFINLFV